MKTSNREATHSTKHKGEVCPHCGGTNTWSDVNHIDVEALSAYTESFCADCHYMWTEYYEMRYMGYDDGYYYYDEAGNAADNSFFLFISNIIKNVKNL